MADLHELDATRSVRPRRWHEYIFERDWDRKGDGLLWREFPTVIPFAILDPRLSDLALSFRQKPDECLLTAYRRLEDIIRNRTALTSHGTRLLSQAFVGANSLLTWEQADEGERAGRGQLFVSAFMAYRNRRAHREVLGYLTDQLREFLLLNELFVLEREACEKGAADSSKE